MHDMSGARPPQPHERVAGSLMRLLDERDFDTLAQRITLLSFPANPLRLNLYDHVLGWVVDHIVDTARFRIGGGPGAGVMTLSLSITGEGGRPLRESDLSPPWPQLLRAVRRRLAPTPPRGDALRASTAATDPQTRAELLLTALTWLDDILAVSDNDRSRTAQDAALIGGVQCVIDGARL